MSYLTTKILNAHVEGKSILLTEDDGSLLYIHAGDKVEIIEGKECEYIEVRRSDSQILYNLNKLKSIEIK